jgi:ABC-type uncharacterized transport system substrate-binding protein
MVGTIAAVSIAAARVRAATKPPRVGYLSFGTAGRVAHFARAFDEGLRSHGWIEGQNIFVERRYAEGDYAKLRVLAAELVNSRADLVVAAGPNPVIEAAKQAAGEIPIVMVIGVDPVGNRFVATLHRPGGNITGLAWDQSPEISEKYPELLKEVVPTLQRIGCVIDPSLKGIETYRKPMENAAARLGLTLHHAEVRSRADFEAAFASIVGRGAQALYAYGSPLIFQELAALISLAKTHRLPDVYIFREAVTMNGFMSYGVSHVDLYRRAAGYADRILRGAKPSDLPVELPRKYELVINLRTAKQLGLTVPQSVLLRADEVVE